MSLRSIRPAAGAVCLVSASALGLVPPEGVGNAWDPARDAAAAFGSVAGGTGSCCDRIAETCQDAVLQGDCSGVGEVWSQTLPCCQVECRSPLAPTYDAKDVALLAHVTIADFQSFALSQGIFPLPHTGNENWGYVSPLGRQYAILGFTTGTGIVEITDPTAPTIVAYVDGQGIDTTWRDMAVYRHFLYVVTDGGGVGMQIVDLSKIDSGTVTRVATSNLGHGFVDAHNVLVNEASGYLYTAIPNSPTSNGLSMYSLADPTRPVLVGTWVDGPACAVTMRRW